MKKRIIGQEHVYKQLKISFKVFAQTDGEIKPHFLLVGPSGNGKTALITALCEEYKLKYIDINAASLTKEGMSGNSITKALSSLALMQNTPTVCFVDEFDKLFITSDGSCEAIHEATRGVQNEFLKVLEGKTMQVFGDYGKYTTVNVGKVLFIFAGAFNNEQNITVHRLSELGIKREFLGRVNKIYEVKKLSLENLIEIAKTDETLEKWIFYTIAEEEKENVRKDCLEKLTKHITKHYSSNVIGARWIPSLITDYFLNDRTIPELKLPEKTMPIKPTTNFFDVEDDPTKEEENDF